MDISACEHHTHILDSVAKYYVLPYNKCLPHTVFSVFFQRICYQWPVTLSSFHTVWCCSGCSQLFWHDDTDTNGWANVNRGTQPAGVLSLLGLFLVHLVVVCCVAVGEVWHQVFCGEVGEAPLVCCSVPGAS